MEAPSRPTLKSIAAVAGVSVMTVSLAMRNSSRIAEETRVRIQELAARLGYKPNSFATSLVSLRKSVTDSTQHRGTLGMLTCYSTREGWRQSPTFTKTLNGARRRAAELGYTVDDFWFTDPELTAARLRQTLVSRGINGLIIGFFDHRSEAMGKLKAFDFTDFASVTISRRIDIPSLHVVSSDQYYDAILATSKLLELGYRRIGLVLNEWVDTGLEHRFRAGFLVRQAVLPKRDHIPVFEAPVANMAIFSKLLAKWVERHRVDAVVAFPFGTHRCLQEAGISIPDKIGIAYLDRPTPDDNLAGIDQNSDLVGAASVDVVVAQIHRNEWGIQPFQKLLMIRGQWKDGWSVQKQAC